MEIEKVDRQVGKIDRQIKKSGLYETLCKRKIDDTVLLLDTSYSMDTLVEGKSCLEHLKDAVAEVDMEIVGFNTEAMVIDDLTRLISTGTTALLKGIQKCEILGYNKICLVSDGLPSPGHRQEAIDYCIDHKLQVSTLFIGEDLYGSEFMKKLAEATGGNTVEDVKQTKSGFGNILTNSIRGLIEGKNQDE